MTGTRRSGTSPIPSVMIDMGHLSVFDNGATGARPPLREVRKQYHLWPGREGQASRGIDPVITSLVPNRGRRGRPAL